MSDCDADSLSGQDWGQSSNGPQGKNGNGGQAGSVKGKRDKRRGKSGKKSKKIGRKEGEKGERQADGNVGGEGCVEPPGGAGAEAQGAGWSRLKKVQRPKRIRLL